MQEILDQIERVAASSVTVMVLGETGVGKEIVAQLIHRAGARAARPFVAVNCSALPETLLESELFGHEKGAFTGADRPKIGRFEQASGGTLFLDEVGEMSPAIQAKLLRVLQERKIERLGGVKPVDVDVRILTATNRNLERMVQEGTFREDLYYRLKVVTMTIPPLRERREEIPILAELFVKQLGHEMGRGAMGIEPAVLDRLFHHSWPGNVRELRNVIQRAIVLCEGDDIRPTHIVLETKAPPAHVVRGPATTDAREQPAASDGALNERQLRVLEILQREGSITNRQYFEIVGVSRRTGLRDLTDLIDRGLILRHGRRKGASYRLAPARAG
jgi:two-component system NtrC family response regulator